MIRTQRVVAVNVTLRRRGEGQQLPQHLLGCGQIGANIINPAFDRRLGNRNQEQRGKKHIPTDLVVTQETSVVESNSHLDFLLLHNLRRRFVA